MPELAGKDFLLKDGIGATATKIAAVRSKSIRINGSMVDGTHGDSEGFRVLVAGAGITSASLTGQGVLTGAASQATMIGRAIDKSLHDYTVEFNNGLVLTAKFQVTSVEAAGEYEGVQTWNIQLESSGAVAVGGDDD